MQVILNVNDYTKGIETFCPNLVFYCSVSSLAERLEVVTSQ